MFFLLSGLATLSSQILNVEKFQSKLTDTTRWFNQIGLNADITQIETTVYEFKERSFTAYKPGKTQYLLLSELKLVMVDGANVISNGYVHVRSSYSISEKWIFELFIQEQFDAVRGLKRRDVQGFDFRWDFLDKKQFSLALATGLMHEYEWWFQNSKEVRNLIKSTSSLLLAFPISNDFSLKGTGYLQFVPDRPTVPRIIWDGSLNWNITKSVGLALTSNVFYDAEPIVDIDPWVNTLTIELVFTW
jgi:hypothetical protein